MTSTLGFVLAAFLAFAPAPTGVEGARDLILLAEGRPIFLRLRVTTGDLPFDSSWLDSVRTLHACLDRDGDGKLTTTEAGADALAALVRLATGGAATLPRVELDVDPKDGVVSIEELAEALRPALGPFRVQIGRLANGRTDALFDHLDRDKDGQLTKPELAAIAGSLRRLDLDDNEMISAEELEPFNNQAALARAEDMSDRRSRFTALPPVVELVAGESSLRLARLLLKKYDKGRDDAPGRPDNKLSRAEFAIDADAFAASDANGDEALTTEELRRFLAKAPVDLVLDLAFSPTASSRATVRIGGEGGVLSKGVKARLLADGDVEFAVGQVRLDVHVDDGDSAAENARRVVSRRFQAADANKDGYLEGKELASENTPNDPLAGLTTIIDRNGDGKIYAQELVDFIDRQSRAARGRLVLNVADRGRAIFGILDLDRDRRLGVREVRRTVGRVTSWDADGDGRVSADEIPYHFQVTITRGELSGLTAPAVAGAAPRSMAAPRSTAGAGPDWFRLMDRNRDGDVSHREFLGPRDQFNRLDRDKDGLIDADEAARVNASAPDGSKP